MMEQVRLCTVWPMENWLGSSLNQTTVLESDSCALEQGYLRIEKEGNLAIGPCECGSIIAFQSHTKVASWIDRMTLQNHTLAAPDSHPICSPRATASEARGKSAQHYVASF